MLHSGSFRTPFVTAARALGSLASFAGFAVLALGWAGCAYPDHEFEEFGRRHGPYVVDDGGTLKCDAIPAPGVIDGKYLFGISSKLKPGSPILFTSTVDTAARADGGLDIHFIFLPRNARSRKEIASEQPIDIGTFPISSTGAFNAKLPPLTVTGAANPVTLDAAITAEVTFMGAFCAASGDAGSEAGVPATGDGGDAGAVGTVRGPPDFYCGLVEGTVTKPIPLDLKGNSHWTMDRMADTAVLPDVIFIDCAGKLADPPPK